MYNNIEKLYQRHFCPPTEHFERTHVDTMQFWEVLKSVSEL